jgi:hypothetical protein
MQRADRPDAGSVAAALAERIADLAVSLLGPPTSRSPVEWRWRRKGSLGVHVAGPKRGRVFDNEADKHGDGLDLIQWERGGTLPDAIRWAQAWLGDPVATRMPPAPAKPPRPAQAAPDKARAALPMQLWREALPAAGSPVEAYLQWRGLDLPPDAPLRFHPACPRGAERLPAMLALMTDPATGQPSGGVHRTFLAPDGRGKATGQAKMMLGGAGIIRLVPEDDVGTGLGIAEGIETALAVMQRWRWRPVWAAGSAGGIANLPVLPGIEALTVFADRDASGTGMKAATACCERWIAAGREARIAAPPAGDFADLAGRAA